MIFVDTSALLALLDGDETDHEACAGTWRSLLEADQRLVTTNYVLVETLAVAQRRLGLGALQSLCADFLPLIETTWLDEETHDAAVGVLLGAHRRKLSLVDCASFEVMRRRGVGTAFTLDRHFAEQGFTCAP